MPTLQTETDETDDGLGKCGTWRLLREVGHGAYGVVYLAEEVEGRRAAVKVCRRDAVDVERYARELRGAKLYRSLPFSVGLVRMREVAETAWGFYSVMDLADDEFDGKGVPSESYRPKTLAKVIEGEKALPLKVCVQLGISLADGLATLQRHHLLHRDIKPGNVIYVGGMPVLSDPGLLVEESEAASLVGTPGYVPPEKFVGAEGDVYSLGLTLKAASFGRSVEDLDKGPAQEADTLSSAFPTWWRILNKATDPVPSRRYQSAKALLKDLKALRVKLAIAAAVWSNTGKLAIVATVLVLIAAAMSSLVRQGGMKKQLKTLEKFKTDTEYATSVAELKLFWSNASRSFHSWSDSWSLSQSLGHTKIGTSDTNLLDRISLARKELSAIRKKSQDIMRRFKKLKEVAGKKHTDGKSFSEETRAAQKLLDEELALQMRIKEIGNSFYRNWKPFHI